MEEEDEKGISRNGGCACGHQQKGIVHGLFLFFCFFFLFFIFLEFLGLLLSLHRSHWIVDNFLQTGINRIKINGMIMVTVTIITIMGGRKKRQRKRRERVGKASVVRKRVQRSAEEPKSA